MRCVLCNNSVFKLLFEVEGYTIEKCTRCGLVVTRGIHKIDYTHYHRENEYIKFGNQFGNIFEKRLGVIKRFFKGRGKVLEIGSSVGILLNLFKKEGWECWGVEPSNSASKAGSSIKVIHSGFEKAKLPRNYFDVVILNHTLEHLTNPVAVIKKVFVCLKSGGLVLADVPNFSSLSSRIMKQNWPYLLPREHLYHFTIRSLQSIFEKCGFSVVYWETRSGVWDYSSPLRELWQSFSGGKKRFFSEFLTLIPAYFISKLNLGTGLTVVARKEK